MRAAHSVIDDDRDSGNEPSGDNGSGHEEPDTSSNEGSDIEVEVTDGEYHENTAEEFMMSMTVKDTSRKEGDESLEIELDVEEADTGDAEYVATSVVFPMSKIATHENANGVKMRKHKLKSSHKRRMRPQATPEEKECLATWVEVNGLKAWALWDSGSTTTGITPAFAEHKIWSRCRNQSSRFRYNLVCGHSELRSL